MCFVRCRGTVSRSFFDTPLFILGMRVDWLQAQEAHTPKAWRAHGTHITLYLRVCLQQRPSTELGMAKGLANGDVVGAGEDAAAASPVKKVREMGKYVTELIAE